MNDDGKTAANAERRTTGRAELDGEVTVELVDTELVGPGQNISDQGVFFVADGAMQVRVRVHGAEPGWRTGELVRVQLLGDGKVGVAIRFV